MERNCNVCGQLYHAEARYVNRGQGLTCGRSCGVKYASQKRREQADKTPNTECAYCHKPLKRKPSQLAKSSLSFCDQACQVEAQRAGLLVTGPVPTGRTYRKCMVCNKRLAYKSRPSTTMHPNCKKEYIIQQWLSGDNSVTLTYSRDSGSPRDTKTFVKEYLLKTRGDRCEECRFDKHGPYGSIIQMDHINGDCFDNRPENLKLLCPNCHAMTPTYGSRNRGSGRAHRRK